MGVLLLTFCAVPSLVAIVDHERHAPLAICTPGHGDDGLVALLKRGRCQLSRLRDTTILVSIRLHCAIASTLPVLWDALFPVVNIQV